MLPTIGSVFCVRPVVRCTCDPPEVSDAGRKLLPVTVSVNAPPPATAHVGDIDVTVGTGFPGGLMMKGNGLESPFIPAPENGLSVLTKTAPGLAISAALTVEVIPSTMPELSVGTCAVFVVPRT